MESSMRIIIVLCKSTLARVASVWKPETGNCYPEIKFILKLVMSAYAH